MPKAVQVRSRGTVERYAGALERLRTAGDYVVVFRGVLRAVAMSCPDGCGEVVTVNLDPRSGPAWRRYDADSRLSLYPSVWRDTGCRAHFIVCRDRIHWCGEYLSSTTPIDAKLTGAVLLILDRRRPLHFEKIADAIGAIPWEVLWSCRDLVRAGLANEGKPGVFWRDGR